MMKSPLLEPVVKKWEKIGTTSKVKIEYTIKKKEEDLYHSFRVVCYWDDNGKLKTGLPSDSSPLFLLSNFGKN